MYNLNYATLHVAEMLCDNLYSYYTYDNYVSVTLLQKLYSKPLSYVFTYVHT